MVELDLNQYHAYISWMRQFKFFVGNSDLLSILILGQSSNTINNNGSIFLFCAEEKQSYISSRSQERNYYK